MCLSHTVVISLCTKKPLKYPQNLITFLKPRFIPGPWLWLHLVVNIGERLCLRLYLLTWRKNKKHAIVTHDNAPGTHQTAPQTVNKLQTSNLSNAHKSANPNTKY